MKKKETTENKEKIDKLLKELNYWVQQGGDKNHRPENIKSTGESNSAFQKTKDNLLLLGVQIEWIDNEYKCIDTKR